ncbi:T-cell ecto-ADP-ribosyltransferase 2-like isoform X16 [Apodemus sylvaticus]|uniref:T-cell ecto-ADP-ribosyltransferase 2-like isoform X16 n=1 Tax=Apodemus sylvaticus TaxID=10129 RepID=UPI0022420D9B|nr:T-cell ecto-ADP-ribosyltransferase 2-like isoform X16 [Apodemus sylvaticus]
MKGTPALPSATLAFRRGQRPSCQTPSQVTGLPLPPMLDMAPNAFDDQYEGCVEEMEEKAPELLQEDFNKNEKLKLEWEKAEIQWKEIKNSSSYPEGFQDFHGIAFLAYTGNLAIDFNRAVREFKKNPGNFHYKAFHYYLTRGLQLLSTQDCHLVYRGSKTKFHYTGTGSVRFGQFSSSSLTKSVAVSPSFFSDHGTLFIIRTCLGVNIKDFSSFPREEEVLIPGYEVYHKVTIQNEKSYSQIFLEDPRSKKSNFNCFYNGSAQIGNIDFSISGSRQSCIFLFLVVLLSFLVQLLALAEL